MAKISKSTKKRGEEREKVLGRENWTGNVIRRMLWQVYVLGTVWSHQTVWERASAAGGNLMYSVWESGGDGVSRGEASGLLASEGNVCCDSIRSKR